MIMVLCNIPLILKNVYFHFLEDCVRFVFPNFVTCFSPFISTSSRIIVAGTKQLLVAIWYLFCTMRQLFFETFGRHFDLFCRRALDSNFDVFIQFCIMFMAFFRVILLICIFYRSLVYNVHKKDREEGAGGYKILAKFVNGCAWFFWGRRFSFRDM